MNSSVPSFNRTIESDLQALDPRIPQLSASIKNGDLKRVKNLLKPIQKTTLSVSSTNAQSDDSITPTTSSTSLMPTLSSSDVEVLNSNLSVSTDRLHSQSAPATLCGMLYDKYEIFCCLLDYASNVDIRLDGFTGMDGNRMSLLHFACLSSETLAYAVKLLTKGANINIEDKFGWTPLHWAAFRGHITLVQLLINNGANANATDADGEIPLDKAIRGGHKDIIDTLSSKSTKRIEESGGSYVNILKLVLIGEKGTGKSSLLKQFLNNEFQETTRPTFGAEFHSKTLNLGDFQYKLDFVDIGGDKRYHCLTPIYSRGGMIFFVVFDITRFDTFEKAKDWILELRTSVPPHSIIVLVGNKIDLRTQRNVGIQDVRRYASSSGLLYVETSAKTCKNVTEVFVYSLKVYHQIVGRFSTTETPPTQKVRVVSTANINCFLEDPRMGVRNIKTHMIQKFSSPEKTGFLTKQGHFIFNWKRRWFSLKGGYLYYYNSEEDDKPLGIIRLRDCNIGLVDPNTRLNCFEIRPNSNNSRHETYYISAETKQELEDWISAIKKSRDHAQTSRNLMSRWPHPQKVNPIPEDYVYMEPLTLTIESDGFSFLRASYFLSYIIKYQVSEKLKVYRDMICGDKLLIVENKERFLISDTEDMKNLFVLQQILPSSTQYGTISTVDYFTNFILAYEYSCDRLQIPFLRELLQDILELYEVSHVVTRINLASIELSSLDIEAIMFAISFYPLCTHLELSDTKLDDNSLIILLGELKYTKITHLDISGNNLSMFADSYISDWIKSNTTVSVLNISNCNLGPFAISNILDTISDSSSIISFLDISSTMMDDRCLLSLIRVIKSSSVTTLICRNNKLTHFSAQTLIISLDSNYTLYTVDFSGNNFSTEFYQYIEKLLERNRKLFGGKPVYESAKPLFIPNPLNTSYSSSSSSFSSSFSERFSQKLTPEFTQLSQSIDH